VSAEWRWMPSILALDAAIFYDAGKVTSRRSDLDFDGLRSNVGFGLRFHGPLTTPVRIEVARGDEGLRLIFTGGAAF
jgi:outer membrane translocation and assembly module TamA